MPLESKKDNGVFKYYDPYMDPSIFVEFTTISNRNHHTLIPDKLELYNRDLSRSLGGSLRIL